MLVLDDYHLVEFLVMEGNSDMEFRTYVNQRYTDKDVELARKYLLGLIDRVGQNSIQPSWMITVRNILDNANRTHYASRYGLDGDISFADSEIINAYQRGKEALAYLKYRYDFKYYPVNHVLQEFPLVVAVEASSKCNLRCKMCFQKNMDEHESIQNRGIMDYVTYERFLSELDTNMLYSIVFASRGEPLLNPYIDRMIKAAKDKGVLDIKLNTNAVLLTPEISRRLLASGLDMIVFSVDSVNEEHYRSIRGADLQLVINNITSFLEIKKNEFPNSRMVVRVAMVVTNGFLEEADKEIQDAKDFWLGLVDELSVKSENNFSSVYADNTTVCSPQICDLLWERLYLWHDGTLNPCDIDHLSTLSLGNINCGTSISEIWKGNEMETLRKKHLYSRDGMTEVCSRCIGY